MSHSTNEQPKYAGPISGPHRSNWRTWTNSWSREMSRAASVCPRTVWPRVRPACPAPKKPLQEPLHAAAVELDDAATDSGPAPRAEAEQSEENAEERIWGSPEHGEKLKRGVDEGSIGHSYSRNVIRSRRSRTWRGVPPVPFPPSLVVFPLGHHDDGIARRGRPKIAMASPAFPRNPLDLLGGFEPAFRRIVPSETRRWAGPTNSESAIHGMGGQLNASVNLDKRQQARFTGSAFTSSRVRNWSANRCSPLQSLHARIVSVPLKYRNSPRESTSFSPHAEHSSNSCLTYKRPNAAQTNGPIITTKANTSRKPYRTKSISRRVGELARRNRTMPKASQ